MWIHFALGKISRYVLIFLISLQTGGNFIPGQVQTLGTTAPGHPITASWKVFFTY